MHISGYKPQQHSFYPKAPNGNPRALSAQHPAKKPVQFSGIGETLVKGAAYGGAYSWCTLKGLMGGLSMVPADVVLLGGAPVTSVGAGVAVLADCVKESNSVLKQIFG